MFDMHMHSICSDGSDNLEELINNVSDADIDFFALTDHDTAEGDRKILSDENLKNLIKSKNLTFVPGMEVSCIYNGTKMHILAYDFDPFAKEIFDIENDMKSLLKEREKEKIELMEKDGYALSKKSKEFLSSRINARTLDFANCLISDGYFDNLQTAARYVSKELKTKVVAKLNSAEVIKKLTGIGAKMVWAHSIYGVGDKPNSFETIEERIRELKPFGLVGLECYYSLYNKEEIDKLLEIAKKYNLFVTYGSDYHGKNKPVHLSEMSCDGTKVDLSNIKLKDIFTDNIIK